MDSIFPKDIAMYIYQIVHKDIMTELNYEYRKCAKYHEAISDERLIVKYPSGIIHVYYNYRNHKDSYAAIYATGRNKIGDSFALPSKYYYSSGIMPIR